MRIALLTHTAELGGAELSSLRLVRALPDDMEVEAFLGEDGPFADLLRAEGIVVHVVPFDTSVLGVTRNRTSSPALAVTSALRSAPAVRRLAALLRQRAVDLLWSVSLKGHLIATPTARLAQVPLVWHLHDRISRDYLPAPVVRAVRALARVAPDAVIANSAATATTVSRAPGLTVAHPGLSDEQLHRSPEPPARSTTTIGVLGRLSETKGQLEVVRLMPTLLEQHPDLRLRLIGAPLFGQEQYEHDIRAEIARLGLQDRVDLVGHVDDPTDELDRLALCVHASTVPEPFGQVVVEALARETPVVVTRGGGATELVHPPATQPFGHLVPMSDTRALAEAISDVLSDPARARARAARGREHVAAHLRIADTARTVAEVFRSVLAPHRTVAEPYVVLAHDYLTQRGGAERVVLAMHTAFPSSPLHTMLYEPAGTFPGLEQLQVVAGVLNRIGVLRHRHRLAFPVLPVVSSLTRVPGQVVVASSSGWAHAYRTRGRRIVYCHAPARWLYQTEAYLGGPAWRSPVGLGLLALGPGLRRWDRHHMKAADRVVVNSRAVQQAVRAAYDIDAEVVHPPPGLDTDGPRAPVPDMPEGAYLVVSRLLPYKNVDVIVDAFRELPERLLVVGSGPSLTELAQALPDNVTLVSDLTDAQLRWVYERARALVAASHEDFGLTPLEAASFGTPTLALRAGGYLDTVIEGVNGYFFDTPTAAAVREAVIADRDRTWDADKIADTVTPFSTERFTERLHALVSEVRQEPDRSP